MRTIKAKYDSINFNVDSPDGKVTVIINEENPGEIFNLLVLVGKSGSGQRALTDALARMISLALENKSLSDVLVELSSITSDKVRVDAKGLKIRSIPEAIYISLLRYRNMYPVINNNTGFRPAKFSNYNWG